MLMSRLFIENVKAAVCGSGGLAFERTNHMLRNMVIGKLKYLIGPASGHYPHPLLDEVQDERNMQVQSSRTL